MSRGHGRRAAFVCAVLGMVVAGLASIALRVRIAEEWWLPTVRSGAPEEQKLAAERLARLGSSRVVPALIEKLGDGKAFPCRGSWLGSRFDLLRPSWTCEACERFCFAVDDCESAGDAVGWERVWPGHLLATLAPASVPTILAAFEREARLCRESGIDYVGRIPAPSDPGGHAARAHWLQETLVHLGARSSPFLEPVFDALGVEASARFVSGLGDAAPHAAAFLVSRLRISAQGVDSGEDSYRRGTAFHHLLALAAMGRSASSAAPSLRDLVRSAPDECLRCRAACALWRIAGDPVTHHAAR